jgi:hypothetical protein
MAFRQVLAAVLLAGASVNAAVAAPASTNAIAQGYCIDGGACSAANAMAYTLAGTSQLQTYRDWFTFAIPTTFEVASANISIFSSAANTYGTSPDAVFSLYAPTSFSYAGLVGNGVSFGSVTARQADPNPNPLGSHYVDIALNTAGLAYINGNLGNAITFGGSGPANSSAQFFGYPYSGRPAILSITPVPEPQTYAMLLAGLGLMGWATRRHKLKAIAA